LPALDIAMRPKREHPTFQRSYEELRLSGYQGGYDAVRRYGRAWERQQSIKQAEAYVPLALAPGEAYQFDWSHECMVIDGVTTMAKGRLCPALPARDAVRARLSVRARRW
jgi:hypothetical protein